MRLYPKLLLSVLPVTALMAGSIVVYSNRATNGALMEAVRKNALDRVAARAPSLAPGLAARDEQSLLPLLQACQRETAASYAAAVDAKGKIVAHTNVVETGKTLSDPLTARALASSEPAAEEGRADERRTLELAVPVYEPARKESDEDFLLGVKVESKTAKRLGVVRLAVPLDDVLATGRRIRTHILWIVVGAVGSLLGALLLILRGALAPIGPLAEATRRIARGEYGAQATATTRDEIGELARSFNEMSVALAKTTVSKDFFNDILEHMQDALFAAGSDGAVTLVNAAAARLVGRSREEIVGRPAAELFDPETGPFAAGALDALAPEEIHNLSTHLLAKDGTKVPVLFSSSTLKDKDGRVTGFIGAAKDVSEVRRLEARMHQSEKLSAVGQLAAGVAHEINNPLGVILGFAQGMARQLQDGDADELPIRSIEREALRCKTLVQDLLTFARTTQSQREALDLNRAVEQALALVQPQAKMGRVKIETALAPGLPSILANKNQVQQIVLNLAKNAIDAMPDGGALTITTELIEGTTPAWACLKVADTGTGIPENILGKIFEPFFTTKPVGQGTGLGLSLISEIVRKHSGEIDVESRPGRTVFAVKFPVRTGRELEERARNLRQEENEGVRSSPYHR